MSWVVTADGGKGLSPDALGPQLMVPAPEPSSCRAARAVGNLAHPVPRPNRTHQH